MCFIAVIQPTTPIDLDSLFKDAEARAQVKRDTIAALQGISLGQWSQQIHGQGHVSYGRLLALAFHPDADGRKFLIALLHVTAERAGLDMWDEFAEAALTVAVGLRGQLRMAKSELRQRNSEQQQQRKVG